MSSSDLETAVANHPFLRGMSPAHLRILAESAMFTRFETGQMVFHQGEIANRFYLIQSGRVSVETRTEEHGVITIQTLMPGDVLGWSWLFAPYYWHFSACALEPTQAIFFYGTRLREIGEEDREFGFDLMRRVTAVLMQRLQVTLKESLRLASVPPKGEGPRQG
jgi:CRP-like cAMP-binding protein